jgi:hypothetical protein
MFEEFDLKAGDIPFRRDFIFLFVNITPVGQTRIMTMHISMQIFTPTFINSRGTFNQVFSFQSGFFFPFGPI